jgi:hypothetical protein
MDYFGTILICVANLRKTQDEESRLAVKMMNQIHAKDMAEVRMKDVARRFGLLKSSAVGGNATAEGIISELKRDVNETFNNVRGRW